MEEGGIGKETVFNVEEMTSKEVKSNDDTKGNNDNLVENSDSEDDFKSVDGDVEKEASAEGTSSHAKGGAAGGVKGVENREDGGARIQETIDGEEADEEDDEDEEGEGEATENVEKNLEFAMEQKERGNEHFKAKEYDEAVQYYSNAIAYCPTEDKEQMGMFLGNRSAAYFHLEEWQQVVTDCTASLDNKPDVPKVLSRRCQALEKLDRLDEALQDAKKILELEPADMDKRKLADNVYRLEKAHEKKMEKLKDEALGKLKELGNTILGNFGMSLDQFNMKQDPVTGSWSISMGQK